MAEQMIAERIAVERRYVRAADIARDLPDPHALDGYVLTSRASEALGRLAKGLSSDSTQRAFRITGPYGSGKSSFGLLLAKLLEGGPSKASAIAKLALGKKKLPAFDTIVLIGSRTSLAHELLNVIIDKAREHFGQCDAQAKRCEVLLTGAVQSRLATKDVLAHLTKLAARVQNATNCGLLVLIDEMGRYLEFAAANPESEDPALFQQLAERASGSAHPALGVVAFLHHRFDDYLASSGTWTNQEWARSAERYEEIAFSEPREQSIHLLARVLEPSKQHAPAVRNAAAAHYKDAAERSLFAIGKAELVEMGASLYPLHPVALSCLATAANRFGQHDRSVFSFMQSSEPAGYLQFAHTTPYKSSNWYRLDHVFDYMASLGSLRFDSFDRDRRWAMGREAVDALVQDDGDLERVLKAVSVIATLEPVPGIRANADTLSWALDIPEADVRAAFVRLADDGVLYKRAASKDYSLWSNSSVDLTYWYAEAERAISKPERLDEDIAQIPTLRPVIAQRHYHRTGTPRSFLATFGETLEVLPTSVDGRIVILPVHPSDKKRNCNRRAAALSEKLGPLALVHLRVIEDADLTLSYQLKCWKWIAETCEELRMDDLARSEVLRNVSSLEQRLQSRLSPLAFDRGEKDWFYVGEKTEIESRAALSRKLSKICENVFNMAPLLRNELINRTKLSSAIAAARMRLLGRMIKLENRDYLGLEGAPPERTIYLSMFQASGMHCEEDGKFGFHPPSEEKGRNWHFSWDRVNELVNTDEEVSFETLIAELGKPPYGLRAGPALLLIAAVMLHHRTTISLVERGTFQPELTDAHFMRLAKNPKHFSLKRLAAEEDSNVLVRLRDRLSIFERNRPEAELKPIVERIFLWWRELDDFSRSTSQLDPVTKSVRLSLKKARDPIQLLFVSLPEACKAGDKTGVDANTYAEALDGALRQLSDALPQLRKQVTARLRNAFGTRSLRDLRQQVRLDYQDHLLKLGDYKLRAFVDRAMNEDLSEELWLDRVASLLVGKRLESWDDPHLDQFGFEINAIAQELARRLATLRETAARSAPVTAIHITTSSGEDRSYYLHEGTASDMDAAARLRKALAGAERPEAVLIETLRTMLAEREGEKAE